MPRSSLPLMLCLTLPACQGRGSKLEKLVPDGATGIVSVDAAGLVKTGLVATVEKTIAESMGPAEPVLDELRDRCKLDPHQLGHVVLGFDTLSQNAMGAIRMPNVGKAEALQCADEVARKAGDEPLWTVSTADGKTSISADDGEVVGWALDDNTLVICSKGWSSAVQARIDGTSKGATEGNLASAVALVDRTRHVWFAAEVPPVAKSFIEETPAAGLVRGGGTLHYDENLAVAVALSFSDEGKATAFHTFVEGQLEVFRKTVAEQGLPPEMADSLTLNADGAVVRGSASVPFAKLLDETTASFTRYINRSKTSEARVQVAKMFDAASAYFTEEHLAQQALQAAPHRCPNNGKAEGQAGITPPLSVDCSKGPSGRCVPGGEGPGGYDPKLWADNPVWQGMYFQQEQAHYFHYNFVWNNGDPNGHGNCQFTAQAFGDLDGDGVFSTYERSGAADQNGVNAAAGMYIDRELE